VRVLITGGTGFIGTALTQSLLDRGCEIVILSRGQHVNRNACCVVRTLDEIADTETLDAVINLAGASLAARRWSASYKGEIVASRMDTTRQVSALLARLQRPPEVLLSASAIGYYGHHGDEYLVEESPVTPGFAQSLCSNWEDLASQAETLGIRVCLLRLGVVLDKGGGALVEMARSFQLGIASWLGSGDQWLSWVHRRDVVRAIEFLLEEKHLQGPFNITSPQPVRARNFATALQLHHRTLLRIGAPAIVMRALIGEMAEELLLNGQRVIPGRLQGAGFKFSYSKLRSALASIYSD
jgi:uncharacterized protein (TIGR01777 family)